MKGKSAKPPATALERGSPTVTDIHVSVERQIADRLRELRDERGLKNEVLAKALGISQSAVRKILGGNAVRQFAKLAVLCRVLHVTPNDLLGFSVGSDRERLQASLEAAAMAWGASDLDAAVTAGAVLATLEEPPVSKPGIPDVDILRIQTAAAVRQALRGRSPPFSDA